jgi:hypothetical protein
MSSTDGPDRVALHLPAELYARVEARARDAGFASPDEYVRFVLEEVTSDDEGAGATDGLSAEEEGDLVDRLRGLGYIE